MPYLAITPAALRQLPAVSVPLAHVAYALGTGGYLEAQALSAALRGGLMVLSDRCSTEIQNVPSLCRSISNECALRRFRGVLADFEQPPQEDRLRFLAALAGQLNDRGLRLYVPEAYAVEGACILICTAISGGTLRERLTQARRHYGAVALDCARSIMSFPLPCHEGKGTPLHVQELTALARRSGMPSFFSSELAANYFTCREKGESRFILFDTVQSLRCKLQLGEELGYETAFFMYPEVCDLLPALFQ